MGKNNVKVTGFRIEDEDVLTKMGIIAEKHCRTRNKEVEYALKLYVADYEQEHGEIKIPIQINVDFVKENSDRMKFRSKTGEKEE